MDLVIGTPYRLQASLDAFSFLAPGKHLDDLISHICYYSSNYKNGQKTKHLVLANELQYGHIVLPRFTLHA
jgi:hypothetical protein